MSNVNVVKRNFVDHLPTVKKRIDQAAFISIDSEFSGLTINRHTRSSLFDTAEERYKKAKRSVSQFTVVQFGLTAFVSVGISRYEAHTYNFYLFPEAIARLDTRFSMQASCIQFLCQNSFDFNKMMYEGIPFINRTEERNVREYWKSNMGSSSDLDIIHKDLLRKYSSLIARWLVQAREGDVFTLEKNTEEGDISNQILHSKLIHRIENIWPKPSADHVLIVEKVSPSRRSELMKASPFGTTDYEKLVEYSLGFTRVINHLIDSQKIIVGHNLYLDLMLIYEKFIDFLPSSYETYKQRLHTYLPHVYDTKYMSLQMRREFEKTVHGYDSTSLSDLYKTMSEPNTTAAILYPPSVKISSLDTQSPGEDKSETTARGQIHEAGYDSFMCGCVFLRLAHLLTISKLESGLATHPIPFYDYDYHINFYRNKVNLIRAMLHNISLDGPDPPSARPDLLFIKTKGYSTKFHAEEVSLLFSSYGTVDVNKISQNKAVAVVGNLHCARRILEAFKSHEKYTVVKYNRWRHSPLAHRIMWTGAILTAGVCTVALIRNVRKRFFP